ncbi:MAG: putative Ig domain-containing protein, partial [Planctomycetes bacterium]|nr:putative Ig domain-containing protein [Planctomycetota bacterium]
LNRTFTQTFTLQVAPVPAPLTVTTSSLPSTTGMSNYSYTLTVEGGVPIVGPNPYSFALGTSSAAWISMDASTGTLSGLVPEGDIGTTHQIEVVVTDRIGTMTSKTLSLVITEHLMLDSTSLPAAEESFTYSHQVVVMGGTAPYTWQFVSGSKPIGLDLNAVTGEITGVPYLGQTGSFEFDILVRDNGTQELQATLSIDVTPKSVNSLTITTAASEIPNGAENGEFNVMLGAGGGVPPYTWSMISNNLPTGLSMTAGGVITGTPVEGSSGRYTVKVRIYDAQGDVSVQNFTFDIAPQYFEPAITTDAALGAIGEGTTILKLLEVQNGQAPFSWSIVSGSLPSGLTLNTNGGSIVGTAQAGTGSEAGIVYDFTIRVTDAQMVSAEQAFSLAVTNDPSKQFQVLVDPMEPIPTAIATGGHYSTLLTVENGVPPMTWTLVGGALPNGIQLGEFGGLYGSALAGTVGQYSFTVEVRDAIGNVTQQTLTMNVAESTATDPNSQIEVIDGIANLPASGSGSGGCAMNESSSLWLLLMVALGAVFAVSRRVRFNKH